MFRQVDALCAITTTPSLFLEGTQAGHFEDGLVALGQDSKKFQMKFDGCQFFSAGVELPDALFSLFM